VGYPGSFSLLETNLNRSLQSGAQTSINMTLVRSNYHQLLDVFSYFNSLYKIHKFAPVIPINSPNSTLDDDMLVLDVELMDDYFKKLRLIPIDKLTIKHGLQSIFINAPNHYKSSGFTLPNCAGGKYKLIVDSDGRVFPCNFFKEENFYCGNILTDDEPLIWHHGKGFTLFRELILEEKIPAKCKSCLKKARCFSGCRAWSSSYNKGGFEYTSDKRCKIGSAFIRS